MLSPALIWFIIGVVFLVLELSVPGFILIFFAGGAWLTALCAWLLKIKLIHQLLVFTISSLVLLFALRKYGLKTFRGETRGSTDDQLTDAKIGKTAVVTKTISTHAHGEIKAMGSFWRATADTEIEEGASVIVESKEGEDGLTFKVKRV